VLGTYETYLEAQSVIDRLSKADFEITGLAIVGNNLTSVELVTGKLTYGRTAIAGAARGAWFGLFIGLMFFLISPIPVIGYVAAAALIGAGISMVLSVVVYTLGRRTRDFTSTNHVLARSYDIIISPQLALRARTILAQPVLQPDARIEPAQPRSLFSPKVSKPAKPSASSESEVAAPKLDASKLAAPGEVVAASDDVSGAELPIASELVAVVAAPRARPAYGELAPEVTAEVAEVAVAVAGAVPADATAAAVAVSAADAAAVKPAPKPRAKRVPKPPVDPAAKD
jgi:hypothetical protein